MRRDPFGSFGSWAQTRQYEPNRNVLTDIETLFGSTSVARFHYVSDALGRRTSKTETGAMFGSYSGQSLQTAWDYNSRSEIQSSTTRDAGTGTALGGRSFTYTYDPIGNRRTSTVDSVSTTYASNALNQYENRTDSGQVFVSGFAPTGATVTANSQTATRQGEYFSKFLGFSNASGPAWASINTVSSYGGSFTRNSFVPMTPETYTYDEDGNILTDGRWVYAWDAENRLISMETRDLAYNVGVPRQKLEFRYDYLGRRVLKQVSGWTGGGWAITSQRRFLYDGWNMITEFNTSSGYTLAVNHVWGIDLSGNLQDAGVVGGLIRSFHYEATNAVLLPAYDGNGNVYNLIDRSNGGRLAAYEYSPFGETLRASGSFAAANPFRFSTKYTDNETQLAYFGARYFSPLTGRFISRDPREEDGGRHLYAYCKNSVANLWDRLGMDSWGFFACGWSSATYDWSTGITDTLEWGYTPLPAESLVPTLAYEDAIYLFGSAVPEGATVAGIRTDSGMYQLVGVYSDVTGQLNITGRPATEFGGLDRGINLVLAYNTSVRNMGDVLTPSGTYKIIVPGSNTLVSVNGVTYTGWAFAQLLLGHPEYNYQPGTPIFLISCSAGGSEYLADGEKNFAEELADALNTLVIAGTNVVVVGNGLPINDWYDSPPGQLSIIREERDANDTVINQDIDPSGRFRTFVPGPPEERRPLPVGE